jgi:hypothetical protein
MVAKTRTVICLGCMETGETPERPVCLTRRSRDARAVTNVTLTAADAEPKPGARRQPKRKESNRS